MSFLIITALILLLAIISEGISKGLRLICVAVLLYTAYTIAVQSGVMEPFTLDGANPLLEWGSDRWGEIKKL